MACSGGTFPSAPVEVRLAAWSPHFGMSRRHGGPDGSMNFGPVAAVVPGFGTDSSGVRGFSDGQAARCWELLHASEGLAGWSSRRIRIGLRQRDGTIPHLWHSNNKNYRSLMHPSRRATPKSYQKTVEKEEKEEEETTMTIPRKGDEWEFKVPGKRKQRKIIHCIAVDAGRIPTARGINGWSSGGTACPKDAIRASASKPCCSTAGAFTPQPIGTLHLRRCMRYGRKNAKNS